MDSTNVDCMQYQIQLVKINYNLHSCNKSLSKDKDSFCLDMQIYQWDHIFERIPTVLTNALNEGIFRSTFWKNQMILVGWPPALIKWFRYINKSEDKFD